MRADARLPRDAVATHHHRCGVRARSVLARRVLIGVGAALLASCASTEPASPPAAVPGPSTPIATGFAQPGAPGLLDRADAVPAPPGARAWRILYHSRDAAGADVAVSGVLLVPDGAPPEGGFPLITYGHPTTGIADRCAPSVTLGTAALPFPDRIAARGWAIVMSDYQGLGTPTTHPYLVGVAEAHDLLDAARAASQVDGAGVASTAPVVVWGFSQGGHAGAFAAQLAPTYAPELDVRGAALAAPVSDVAHFASRGETRDDQFGVLATIVTGYTAAYPELDAASVFDAGAAAALPALETDCIGTVNERFTALRRDGLRAPATSDAAFAARFAENRAGDDRVLGPVLLVQGQLDDIIDPADTEALARRWCDLAVGVDFRVADGARHGVMEPEPFVGWTADLLAGTLPASTCGTR